MNVLGSTLTILCLSAGHLLGSDVVWQLQLECYCVPGCARLSSWAFAPFHTATKAEKHDVVLRQGGNPSGALLGRSDSPSVYPLMTRPMQPPVIVPSFTSIARTLREG